MATVYLDRQIFYTPPVAAGPEPVSRGLLVRKGDPSTAIFEAPLHPPPPQDAHDPRRGCTGKLRDDAVLIPSDDESDDDLDGSRSDTSFPPLDELLAAACNEVKSGSVVGTGKSVDAAPGDSDAPELSVTSGAGPDDESASNQQQRRRSLGCSPEPLSVSPEALQAKRAQPAPAPDGTLAGRQRHALQHDPRPSAELCGKTSNRDGTICLDNDEWDKRFPFSLQAIRRRLQAKRANKSACKAAEPDQPKSVLDSRCRAKSPRSAASSLGVETQQRSDSCRLSPHYDHRDESDQTSDAERRHPPVPHDRGEQNKERSTVPPQAQESRASTPTLSDDESISELELANAEPSMQPSASQDRVNLQRESDYRPIVGSDGEHGQDDDVQPQRRKRRRVSTATVTIGGTASQQQTHCPDAQSAGVTAAFPTHHRHEETQWESDYQKQVDEAAEQGLKLLLEIVAQHSNEIVDAAEDMTIPWEDAIKPVIPQENLVCKAVGREMDLRNTLRG
ncbi:hypothetical protein QBC46DRAFT_431472 [Diplogelasinospora grovesii]|uniref:Uncharacterized protein n=1 Tax=Diplogelasinospora grovesii TaxID=303347 RepID=A0AAN6RZ23_9PEZI|nr:hypothetical protein QBC46DRAFT_431472 [Diplogelasinospora grovesii]